MFELGRGGGVLLLCSDGWVGWDSPADVGSFE